MNKFGESAWIIKENCNLFRKYENKFLRTFHIRLSRFFNPWIGFDVIAFDRFLHVPDDISTKDFVKNKYGDPAVTLIKNLIHKK